MAVKYSTITREQYAPLENGFLHLYTLDDNVFTREVGNGWSLPSGSCIELERGLYLAMCEDQQTRFILYPDFKFNVIRKSDNLLLDFGVIESFRTAYTFELIGSTWYKGSYKGVFIERSVNIVYIADNVHTPCSLKFNAGALSAISAFDESYCLGICRTYTNTAVCGVPGVTFLLNLQNGEVTKQ